MRVATLSFSLAETERYIIVYQPTLMPTSAPTLNPQGILQLLDDSTNGPSWSVQSYCEFHGIACDDSEQITGIDLVNNNLQGPIPSEIVMLLSLSSLELHVNSITGTIPSEIGMLSSMISLEFHVNSITGKIPSEND